MEPILKKMKPYRANGQIKSTTLEDNDITCEAEKLNS